MIKTNVLINDKLIGYIETEKEIKNSIINDFKPLLLILELSTLDRDPSKEVPIDYIFKQKLRIVGVPKLQRLWDYTYIKNTDTHTIIEQPVLRPDGMCVACSGTGKYRAKTFKSTAKCPSCKGSGYITNVWNNEEENNGNRTDMVAEGQDNNGSSSSKE